MSVARAHFEQVLTAATAGRGLTIEPADARDLAAAWLRDLASQGAGELFGAPGWVAHERARLRDLALAELVGVGSPNAEAVALAERLARYAARFESDLAAGWPGGADWALWLLLIAHPGRTPTIRTLDAWIVEFRAARPAPGRPEV